METQTEFDYLDFIWELYMKKILITAVLAFTASYALAGDVLWQNIENGMTVEQVHALYPRGKADGRNVEWHAKNTELHGFLNIGDCKPRVEIIHPNGTVTGVIIWMRPAGILKKMCVNEARDAVMAKFGAPTTQDKTEAPLFGSNDTEENMHWVTPTMHVAWYHDTSYDAWRIEYRSRGTTDASRL